MAAERVNPAYYQSENGLEYIDVIERFGSPFCRSDAVKYLWHHRQKNGKEDLVKILWYLNRETGGSQKLPLVLRPNDTLYRGVEGDPNQRRGAVENGGAGRETGFGTGLGLCY